MTVDYFLIDAPHTVPQEFAAWEAAKERHHAVFLRCIDAPDGSAERAALDAEGKAAKIEATRLERVARQAWKRVPRRAVEIHIHDDRGEARHRFTDQPLRFHAGFAAEDAAAGWRQAVAFYVFAVSDEDLAKQIDQAKARALDQLVSYWRDLAAAPVLRVIHKGEHYTRHELGKGIGFAGEVFRVEWLAADQEPTVCNLFAQGRIPTWMRDELPDNARSIEDLGYRIDPFPDDLDDADVPY